MPQMSPLQWEMLFLLMLIMMMVLNSKFFFIILNTTKSKSKILKSMNLNTMNWMW